jgi:hypothetical protein
LFADLDAVHPTVAVLKDLEPTYAWQTSPGRYQAMWRLDRPLEREPFEDLNQRVTYFLGADKSGWDVAQLLRIPGSVSTKHGKPYRIRHLACDWSLVHRVENVQALVRHVQVDAPAMRVGRRDIGQLPQVNEVWHRHRRALARVPVLKQDCSYGDRSGTLWHTYPKLFAAGLTPQEAFVVVQASVWNKWPHQPDRLWQDVGRAFQRYADARCLDAGTETSAGPSTGRVRSARENGRGHE